MSKRAWIGVGAVALLMLALLTVLNKRWWARRIMRKWDIASNLEANTELLSNTSLKRMIDIYRNGMEGWTLRGTKGGLQADGAAGDEQVSATGTDE